MKTPIVIVAALLSAAPVLFAQDFDFKTLDKMGEKAKSKASITLDGDMLKLLAGTPDKNQKDPEAVMTLASKLKNVYVRNWEFNKEGQYNEADLTPFRNYLQNPKWKPFIDVKENGESTQIYFATVNNKMAGIAVISAEPEELTIVYIDGAINMSDLGMLGTLAGVPGLGQMLNDSGAAKQTNKAGNKADNKSKTDK
jgi:hypothetical protein